MNEINNEKHNDSKLLHSDDNTAIRIQIHDAYIGISVNGRHRHGVSKVFVNMTDENVEIIIEDLHTFCIHNTNRFTPETDDISIINNTLQIKPKAPLFGLDVIEITAK